MRSVARGFEQRDIGKVIENAVYLKLAGEGWDVRSGRVFGSLLGIHDAWPRYVVSMDPRGPTTRVSVTSG